MTRSPHRLQTSRRLAAVVALCLSSLVGVAQAAPDAGPEPTATLVPGPCDSDIDFGEVVSCTVTSPSQVRELDFAASAGDRIRVRVVVTGGAVNPTASILRGAAIVCSPTFADDSTCTLTSNGTHTLKVDAGGTGTGSFSTTIQRLNDPVGCTSLAYGVSGRTSNLNAAAKLDCFSQNATAGQRWRIRVVETSGTANLLHEVIRPDGSTVCFLNGSTDSTCLLDANGQHRVLVQDAVGVNTGNYRIVLERFPGPVGCDVGAFNASRTVRVDDAGAIACVTFAGSTGDRFRVRVVVSSGAWNPITEVVAADGSTVCGATFADEQTCTLAANGTHTVIVRDGGGTGQATGQAKMYVQRLNDPEGCPALKPGPTGKTGSISPAVQIDCRSQDATAGQRWRIRVVETSGTANLLHEVVRPDGSTVCFLNGSTESTCLLDASGEHRILVEDATGLNTGDYRVLLERFPKPTGCPLVDFGAATDVEVAAAGAITCVQIDGKAGDRMRVRTVVTGGTWNPLTDLVAKDGSTVCGVTFADDFTCLLTSSGKHTVTVRDGGGTGASLGTADLFIQRLNDPVGCASIAYGPNGKTASINDPVEIDCQSQTATAGQRWRVRVVETSGTANLLHEVVRPDGSTVCFLNGSTESTCLLDVNGEHRVLTQDATGLNTGNYRVVLERFPNPAGCGTTTVDGPVKTDDVTLAGGTSCFTFNASAGDGIQFSVPSTGGTWNPLAEVLRADGTTLCGPTFADDFSCTLTTNGKHTVIVRDGGGTGSATGSYSLKLDEV